MAGAAAADGPRYWAFISYSHRDAAFGRRLHRRLETYVLPRRLIGHATPQGTVPARLSPIFRDREEFPAAHDLSVEVQIALEASRSLIVVCSPDAATSDWVSREVELFRTLHPRRPILAAIRIGDPHECFPAALIRGAAGGESIEPLAADFRRAGDGDHLGLLKLVAGIAGIRLDELVQRDAQRHRQRVTAITATSVAAMLAMGALTAFALRARNEAQHQRSEAEGLVEYMLTDLRDRLRGVGRLDVMTAVNERALHYYSDEDIDSLPADSLERRARILHAMGEDDEARSDEAGALAKFREAERTTAALLSQRPDDPERIFNHAQSEYWIGYENYSQGRIPAAKQYWLTYRHLAERMVAIAPGKTRYRRELGYAEDDLCAVAMKRPADVKGELRHCSAALAAALEAERHSDGESQNAETKRAIVNEVMNCLANMADAFRDHHDFRHAREDRIAESKLLTGAIAADPRNVDLQDTLVAIQIAFAELDKDEGHMDAARTDFTTALQSAEHLHQVDPHNARWIHQRDYIANQLRGLHV